MLAEASRFPFSGLEVTKRIDHITYYTPIQDSAGIITPAPLHFMQTHASEIPDLDPKEHRLTIHGMVERPLSFTLDELKRLPSVSRIHFVECHGNGSPARHSDHEKKGSGVPIQFVHGMTSCSEWTGVLLSVLLKEAGVKKEASWLVYEGGDPGKYTYTLPLAKAMDDVMVAYAQNGEPVRPAQGHPLRMLVPGWEGPFSVKWLKHIKVVDQPYITWNEAMNHSIPRPDLGGKSRWHHFQMAPKSVITRPSSGHTLSGPGFYEITGLAWSGYGTVRRVEISIDGGKTWKDARLQAPILRMAHTRFNFDWNWDGQETLIQSRCTDDQGETQLSVAELYKNWGYTDYKSQDKTRAIHFNAIQPWRIAKDGSVYDAMFD
ncbi:MAG: sulfite dehydrogenase [Acidobacteria bacterium]|nr:MAG: sulfite dehydrogenase [Acidobacteriota bacterium]